MRIEADLFEHRDQRINSHFAPGAADLFFIPGKGVENLEINRKMGIGKVVYLDSADIGLFLGKIKTLDLVLPAAVEIDGLFMNQHRSAETVHFADNLRLRGGHIDDYYIFAGGTA